MARVAILCCDRCKLFDSDHNPVRRVTVCGPRFELCQGCRIEILTMCRVSPPKASAYVHEFDQAAGTRGPRPSISDAPESGADDQADEDSAAPETQGEPLPGLDVPAAADAGQQASDVPVAGDGAPVAGYADGATDRPDGRRPRARRS